MRRQSHTKTEPVGAYDRRVSAEQIKLIYLQLPFQLLAVVVLSGFTALVLWDFVDRTLLVGWTAAIWLLAAVRLSMALHFRNKPPPLEDMSRWGRYAVISSAIYGGLWGFASAVFLAPEQPLAVVFMCIVLVGTAAGSFAAQSAYLPAFVALVVPMLSPLVVRLGIEHGPVYRSLSIITAFFLVALIGYARNYHRTLTAATRLGFENADLAAQLALEKERAEQANLAKSQFLAAASHDLRQPIHAQGLLLDALDAHVHDPVSRKIIDDVKSSGRNLNQLLDALLDISKLDAGAITPELAHFPVQPVLDNIVRDHTMWAQEKGLVLRVAPSSAVVYSDRAMLQRILGNLVTNAVRYTETGRILVGARRRKDSLQVVVCDTGPGIPENQVQKIFEEFYQVANPARDRAKGLGLGLAIVRRLAALLGHEVGVVSRLGKGSVFSVTIPRGDAGAVVTESGTTDLYPDIDVLEGAHVLVIDDEAAVREATAVLLGRWGCRVTTAGSAADGLRQLDPDDPPHVIVADYGLHEGYTGVEAIEDVRAELQTDLPALILTGDTAPQRISAAQASGLHLLHKPVSPAKLRSLLTYLLAPAVE